MVDPVRLDPFQNIVNVNWGGLFLALVVRSRNDTSFLEVPGENSAPVNPWSASPNFGTLRLMNGSEPVPLNERVAPSTGGPAIGFTVTPDMQAFYYAWSYPNFIVFDPPDCRNVANFFFNVEKILTDFDVETMTIGISRGIMDDPSGLPGGQAGLFVVDAILCNAGSFPVDGDGILVTPPFIARSTSTETDPDVSTTPANFTITCTRTTVQVVRQLAP